MDDSLNDTEHREVPVCPYCGHENGCFGSLVPADCVDEGETWSPVPCPECWGLYQVTAHVVCTRTVTFCTAGLPSRKET